MSGRPTRCLDLIFTLTPRPRGLQAGAGQIDKKKDQPHESTGPYQSTDQEHKTVLHKIGVEAPGEW